MSVIQNADWATIIETVVCLILIVAIAIEHRRLSRLKTGAATSIGGCEVLGGGRAKAVYVRIEFSKAERTEARRVIGWDARRLVPRRHRRPAPSRPAQLL
jgi:hypothetical protein